MTPLRERMIEDMEMRNFSPETIKGYLFHVSRFAKHFNQSPDLLGIDEIRQYQVYLLRERKVAASTVNHVLSALRFLYKVTLRREWALDHLRYPRRAKRLPAVLSKPEVYRAFSVIRNLKHRTLLMTMYATGMRVSEAARLRVDDIDSKRMLIRVHQGKGKKDRYVPLSATLLQTLRTYWKKVRSTAALFPSQQGGGPLTTGSITKVCADARKKAGLSKRLTPHTFRHSFATVPSARRQPERSGWRPAPRISWKRWSITTRCSPFRINLPSWRCRTRKWCTTFCSAACPKP